MAVSTAANWRLSPRPRRNDTQVVRVNATAIGAKAAHGDTAMVMDHDDKAKVSFDFNLTTQSCIFAPNQSKVIFGRTVSVLAWCDNARNIRAAKVAVAATMGRLN